MVSLLIGTETYTPRSDPLRARRWWYRVKVLPSDPYTWPRETGGPSKNPQMVRREIIFPQTP